MPKVTQEHRDARRLQIAVAALRCFARSGIRGTTMADIIAESGLSAGAIYGHFASKEDIVRAAASEILENRIAEVSELAALSPLPAPGAVLGAILSGVRRDVGDPRILVQVWAEAMTDPVLHATASDTMLAFRALLAEYLTGWFVEHGVPDVEAPPRASRYAPLMISLIQGFIVQSAIIPDFDGDGYLEAIEGFVLA